MNKRVICVFDLKAFYATAECVDRGLDPNSTPLVVCDKERGKNTIILSVTPYLKKQGISSRLRLQDLPKGREYIYAIPRMSRYIELSYEVISILLRFADEKDIHVYSIDEVFIDFTKYLSFYKMDAISLVKKIIKTVKDETGLIVAAGIGDSLFLSKVALDNYAKSSPDLIGEIYQDEIKEKLWPISPLNKIWGIGINTEVKLNKYGIYDMGDLANSSKEFLKDKFGVMGEQLWEHANGIDESDIHEVYVPEETSLTIGQTLMRDYSKEESKLLIREMCEDLCERLHLEKKLTKCVHLYVGYSKAGGASKQMSLNRATDDTDELYDALIRLLDMIADPAKKIRRLSIAFGKLKLLKNAEQLSIFTPIEQENEKRALDYCIADIKNKYGKNSLFKASSLLEGSTALERHNQIGGHRK